MDAPFLLGLDVGGSYVKATAFDLGRGAAVTRGKPVPVLHPAPGHNERDARLIWHEIAEVVHRVMDLLPPGRRVGAVGITGHGNGLYLVDHKGRPTRNAVMASDTRAAGQVRQWIDAGVQEHLAPLTWNRLWPVSPVPFWRGSTRTNLMPLWMRPTLCSAKTSSVRSSWGKLALS